MREQRTEVGDAEGRRVHVDDLRHASTEERREVLHVGTASAEVATAHKQCHVFSYDTAVERNPFAEGRFRAVARVEKGKEEVPGCAVPKSHMTQETAHLKMS